MKNNAVLYLVIPCYNEEEVLNITADQLLTKITMLISNKIVSPESRIVFVNDGSRDKTWNIITELHKRESIFQGINLSRNRGHQNALLAGMLTVKEYADIVISLDADLQDDIGVIEQFINKYYEGYEIVYGVRSSRKTDSVFKRNSASFFYKTMKKLGADVINNHADYRLLSKRVLDELSNYKEVNLFLRGIVPLIGFESTIVYYERHERFAGESKYPLKKMIGFALDGITSLSNKPIRFISFLGIGVSGISIFMLLYIVFGHIFTGKTVPGWTSLIVSIWGIGGLQLLAIGIIGEYIGKIYLETKARPRYIVKEYLK